MKRADFTISRQDRYSYKSSYKSLVPIKFKRELLNKFIYLI